LNLIQATDYPDKTSFVSNAWDGRVTMSDDDDDDDDGMVNDSHSSSCCQ
jgi:hypothetical protein